MLVGEQPGDKEDLAGKPFVGPAGQCSTGRWRMPACRASDVFVTNAVKHFKHEMRGKRRLHKRPNAYEIERCKWWLDQERAIVKPEVDRRARRDRGAQPVRARRHHRQDARRDRMQLPTARRLVVTIHPSALLRIEDEADKEREYAALRRRPAESGGQLGRAGRRWSSPLRRIRSATSAARASITSATCGAGRLDGDRGAGDRPPASSAP